MSRSIDSRQPAKTRRPVAVPESVAVRRLLALVDLGLAGVVFLAPMFMGGRYEIGRLVYVLCVSIAACGWAGHQWLSKKPHWRWSGAEPLLLGALVLLSLQLTPLPPTLLQRISPEVPRLLPLWNATPEADSTLGGWQNVTVAPQATRAALVTLLAHGLLFLVVVQRLQERRDIERMLRWLACSAMLMAGVGLAQFLFGNGRFLWVYEHPSRDTYGVVKGTFQNQNHFAHFLILGLGPLVWWLQRLWDPQPAGKSFRRRSSDRQQLGRAALAIGLGLVAIAILLTFSRGGVIAAFVATTLCLSLMIRRGLLAGKALLAIGGMTIVLVAALAIHGYEPLAARLSTLRDSQTLDEICHGRSALWKAHLTAIPRFLLFGAGAGSHRDIYPTYLETEYAVEFTHAENGYLQVLLETGVTGLLLALIAAGMALGWSIRVYLRSADRADAAVAAVVLAGLVASLVHAGGDFVWYLPACFSLTLILAACGCRTDQLIRGRGTRKAAGRPRKPSEFVLPRSASLGILLTVGIAVAAMMGNRIPPARGALHWDAYFRLSLAEQAAMRQGEELCTQQMAAMGNHLQRLLQQEPRNHLAHLRLAWLCLQEFDVRQMDSDHPMPLIQIRDAALASEFPDQQSLDAWLTVVLGENRSWLDRALWHTYQGLQRAPLHGEGYVFLAELGFLRGQNAADKRVLLQQAQTVRPYSSTVMMAAGREAFLEGDDQRGLALWKKAFQQAPQHRRTIIETLAAEMPVAVFLEQFEPDLSGQRELYAFYRRRQLTPQLLELAVEYGRALVADAEQQTGSAAALRWSQAASVYQTLEDPERFVACAEQAVHHAPDDFARRRALARAYQSNQQYELAIRQLKWCLSRQPGDRQLEQELHAVNRLRVAGRQTDRDSRY